MSKKPSERISFLVKKKDSNELFDEIISKRITKVKNPVYLITDLKGKTKFQASSYKEVTEKLKGTKRNTIKIVKKEKPKNEYSLKGVSALAKELRISPVTLRKYIFYGNVISLDYSIERRIENLAKSLKVKKTKISTKRFTIHNFTRANFFKKESIRKILDKNKAQYLFRAGLRIRFKRKNQPFFIIANFPITFYDGQNYSTGFEMFFEEIKRALIEFPSLYDFTFNYMDVTIHYYNTIDKPKVKKK